MRGKSLAYGQFASSRRTQAGAPRPSRHVARLTAAAGTLLALWACSKRPLPWPPGRPTAEAVIAFEQDAGNQLDVLFVIDNSRSMEREQANLIRNFPAFMEALKKLPGGLPDLHVGVVSTDVGSGGSALPGCTREGDDGVLQASPRGGAGACSAAPEGRYLESLDRGTRNNFQGDISDAFACIAELGARGCGFEQPLEAARRALGGSGGARPQNAGFLRPRAALALIIITDEDDCSIPPGAMVFRNTSDNRQCAVLGHECAEGIPQAIYGMTYSDCHSNENGPLTPVADFVKFVRSLKRSAGRLLVSVIAAPPSPYQMGTNEVRPSCSSMSGEGSPGVRMRDFVDAFGDNGIYISICAEEFDVALTGVGERLGAQLFSQCLDCPLADEDPDTVGLQASCAVIDRFDDAGGSRQDVLPACDDGASPPCWRLVAEATCRVSGYTMTVDRGAAGVPQGALTVARCEACVDPEDPRCLHR